MENVLAEYLYFTFFLKVDWEYFIAFLKHLNFLNGKERIKIKILINISAFGRPSVINWHTSNKFLACYKI